MNEDPERLTIALPKGRLLDHLLEHFAERGLGLSFADRRLIATDDAGTLKAFLVKNNDLPTYVNHGIAGLGICGTDVLYESGHRFFRLLTFSFGRTKMCLAGGEAARKLGESPRGLKVATKFTRFTQDYFHGKGLPVQVVKLEGSVELAPILGLAPLIVDLVETGETLRANNLHVIKTLKEIEVHLIANPSFYKLNYRRVNEIVDRLREGKR